MEETITEQPRPQFLTFAQCVSDAAASTNIVGDNENETVITYMDELVNFLDDLPLKIHHAGILARVLLEYSYIMKDRDFEIRHAAATLASIIDYNEHKLSYDASLVIIRSAIERYSGQLRAEQKAQDCIATCERELRNEIARLQGRVEEQSRIIDKLTAMNDTAPADGTCLIDFTDTDPIPETVEP